MAYRVIDITDEQFNPEIGLGISLDLLQPIFFSKEQATENLKNLLLTKKGERLLQPTFGTDLLYALFDPNTNSLKQIIDDLIRPPVSYWLPYIDIQQINITTAEDDPNLDSQIRISIEFSISEIETNTILIDLSNNGQLTISEGS